MGCLKGGVVANGMIPTPDYVWFAVGMVVASPWPPGESLRPRQPEPAFSLGSTSAAYGGVMAIKRVPGNIPRLVLLFALGVGCTSGSGARARPSAPVSISPASTSWTPSPAPTPSPSRSVRPALATPGRVTNKWFPLEAGLQIVKLGEVNVGHRRVQHRRVVTITGATKMVDGRTAVLVLDQDFDGGEVAEQALDYVAIDAHGAVRFVGSYTESYEGGQFVSAADAWLAGVKGAIQGTLMPAAPRAGTPEFVLTDIPGGERTTAQVFKTGQSVCVPFACYKDVVILKEGSEWKYHAPGVGEIKLEPHYSGGGPQETERLINVTQLSAQSRAEIDAEVLRLDAHARQTAPGVFGRSQPARRTR